MKKIIRVIFDANDIYLFVFFEIVDEKEKFDSSGFRDLLVQGLLDAGTDLDAVSKFLDGAGGSKLDYRRYGETLFDVLIAGGIIGTSGVTPGENGNLAPACVFAVENSMEALRAQEQVKSLLKTVIFFM